MSAPSRAAFSVLLATVVSCNGEREAKVATEVDDRSASAPAAQPLPKRRSLPDAAPIAPGTTALDGLERIDLQRSLGTGEATIDANDERVRNSLASLVDGEVGSWAVTQGINPLEVTITLQRPIRLRVVRVFPVGSQYDWVLEPLPGQDRSLRENVPERAWSQLDLDAAIETSVVRLEILRLERDDFVHVGEIELYAEATP